MIKGNFVKGFRIVHQISWDFHLKLLFWLLLCDPLGEQNYS